MSEAQNASGPTTTAGAIGAGLGRLVRGLSRPAAKAVTSENVRSIAASAGQGAGRAARTLNSPQSRNVARGLFSGARVFWVNLQHVMGLLFLEVTGAIFLFIGLGISAKAWSEYQAHRAGAQNTQRMELAIALAVMFLYFGISSFWRSRRKARR
jgi:hypothetical protein